MKSTTIVVGMHNLNIDAKPIPSITFCPAPAFKVPGFQFTQKGYNDNVYTFQEMFYDGNLGMFNVSPMDTPIRGRCYTLLQSQVVKKSERALVRLKSDLDATVRKNIEI